MVCKCEESKKPIEQRNWSVMLFKCEYSNSGVRLPSKYSVIHCNSCYSVWRTKSDYVYKIKPKSTYERTDK